MLFPKAKIITTTKEIVDELLSMNIQNRNIKPSVVSLYKKEIQAGNWKLTNQGIGITKSGVLVDGQHRLEAIKACGYPNLQILIVEGLDEDCQICVDQHSRRTMRDVLYFIFNERVSRHVPAVCNCLLKDDNEWSIYGNCTFSSKEVSDKLYECYEEIEKIVQTPKNKNFFAAPYLAAFVKVAKKTNMMSKIINFMYNVEDGEMLNKDMPAYHLRSFIIKSCGLTAGTALQKERFQKTEKATLAHLDGKKMGILR